LKIVSEPNCRTEILYGDLAFHGHDQQPVPPAHPVVVDDNVAVGRASHDEPPGAEPVGPADAGTLQDRQVGVAGAGGQFEEARHRAYGGF
jgi:hypothetical protein